MGEQAGAPIEVDSPRAFLASLRLSFANLLCADAIWWRADAAARVATNLATVARHGTARLTSRCLAATAAVVKEWGLVLRTGEADECALAGIATHVRLGRIVAAARRALVLPTRPRTHLGADLVRTTWRVAHAILRRAIPSLGAVIAGVADRPHILRHGIDRVVVVRCAASEQQTSERCERQHL